MPKVERRLKYKAGVPGMVGTKASVYGSFSADHGSLAGLADDDHPQYPEIAEAETVSGDWTITGSMKFEADLYLSTGIGITHADGVTAGNILRADGTRYIPDTLDIDDLTDIAYAAPALTLGLANAEGAANTVIRTDATILAFDANVPTSLAPDDAAAAGAATVAARRDHGHGIPTEAPTINLSVSTTNAEGAGYNFVRDSHTHAIDSSSGPGAAASLLASSAAGKLTLVDLELSSLTASTVIYSDAGKEITSLANAAGFLENDGAGGLSWGAAVGAHDILSASHSDTAAAAVTDGDIIIGNATPKWSELAISVPAANVRNVLGVDNGETRPSWKTALDNTNPVTLTVSTAAAPGTSLFFSHRDHAHAVTSASNPGAAASLLASDANGYLQLVGAGIGAAPASADLHFATGVGITHADGVAAGNFLRANGTRYIPDTLDISDITDLAYAVPNLTLTTANAAGAANTVIRSDASILVFDATVPNTIECDDAAAVGVATVAARRDHEHAIVCAIAGSIAPDDAAAEGSAVSFARSDHTHGFTCAAPDTNLSVSTTNAEGAGTQFVRESHTHAIDSSANPGAAASLLASTAAGLLTLVQLDTDTISDKSGGNLTISPTGDIILNPTGNDILPTTNYDLNLGSVSKKYKSVHASELAVGALVADGTSSGIKGRMVIAPTTLLSSDLGNAATQMSVEDNEMIKDDTAYLEAAGNVEFILIAGLTITDVDTVAEEFDIAGDWTATFTAGVKFTVDGSTGNDGEWTVDSSSEAGGTTTIVVTGNITDATVDGHILYTGTQGTGPYTYLSVTRNRDASGANDWYAGDYVANTGQAADGFIDIYSVDSILGTTTNGAAVIGGRRESTTYDDVDEMWQLNGATGLSFLARLDAEGMDHLSWHETNFAGDKVARIGSSWDGGAADVITLWVLAEKQSGVSAGDAVVNIGARDLDATDGWLALESSGQLSLGPDSGPIVNANMTYGWCVNQDTADNEIGCFKSSDVAHGGTTLANTDVFGLFKKVEGAAGGLLVEGLKDSGGTAFGALNLRGELAENVDDTKDNTGLGIVNIDGLQISGTGWGNTVSNGNVLSVRTRRGGSVVTLLILDEDGDLHLDAGAGDGGTGAWAFDEHDDMALLTGLRASTAPAGHEMHKRFEEFIDYARPILEATGVVHYGEDRPFVSMRGLQYLTIDALRQFCDLTVGELRQLKEQCQRYEQALLQLGVEPAQLGAG